MDDNTLAVLSPIANGFETFLVERKAELCRILIAPTVQLRWVDLQPDNYEEFVELQEEFDDEGDFCDDDDADDVETGANPLQSVKLSDGYAALDLAHRDLLSLKMRWLQRKYEDLARPVDRTAERAELARLLAQVNLDEHQLAAWLATWRRELQEAAIYQRIVNEYGEKLAPAVLGVSKVAEAAMVPFVIAGIGAKTAFDLLSERFFKK